MQEKYVLIVGRKSGKVAFPVNTCILSMALNEFLEAERKKHSEVADCKHFSLPAITSLELIQTYPEI